MKIVSYEAPECVTLVAAAGSRDLNNRRHQHPHAEVGESTVRVRERVAAARAVAEQRWRPHGIRANAEVSGPLVRREFRLDASAMLPLRNAMDRGLISVRGVD